MNKQILQDRTRAFALDVLRLSKNISKGREEDILLRQLIRSATSVGANYRASCRARSKAEFLSKMGIVEEEADESIYWLELLMEGGYYSKSELEPLVKEANEILAIVVSSINTTRKNLKK